MNENNPQKSDRAENLSSTLAPIIVAILGLIGVLATAYATLVAAGKAPNPFNRLTGTTAPIAGTWSGTIKSADGTFQTDEVISIQPDCKLGQSCGTYDTPALGCKGSLVFKGVSQGTFEFTEVKDSSAPDVCKSNGVDSFTKYSDNQLTVSFLLIDPQGTFTSSGTLTQK